MKTDVGPRVSGNRNALKVEDFAWVQMSQAETNSRTSRPMEATRGQSRELEGPVG